MKLGYVRPSPWYTAARQIEALRAYAVEVERIYVEGRDGESLAEAIRVLEPGDELCLATADRLTNRRTLIAPTLDDIHEKGAVAVDVRSGQRSTGYHFMADAIAGLARDRRKLTRAEARKMGAAGGRPAAKPLVPIAQARAIWKDITIDGGDALVQIGLSKDTAYRMFGPRGMKAGRPKKRK